MEVVVSGSPNVLRIVLVGEVDEAAAAVVHAAAAVAKHDGLALHIDLRQAYPRSSPIFERIERTIRSAADRQPVVVR